MRIHIARRTLPAGCFLLLGLAGCADLAGPRSPEAGASWQAAHPSTSVTVTELEFTQFVDCAGENVVWTGTTRVVRHTTTNRGVPPELPEGVFQHSVELESLRLTGVGETSGAAYRLRSALHVIGQAEHPVNPFPIVFRVALRDLVIRHPGGAIGRAGFTLDLRVNGTGETVLERVREFTLDCR
jgi:hypothetical protein